MSTHRTDTQVTHTHTGVHSQVSVCLQVLVQSDRQSEQTPISAHLQHRERGVEVKRHAHTDTQAQQHTYTCCHGDTTAAPVQVRTENKHVHGRDSRVKIVCGLFFCLHQTLDVSRCWSSQNERRHPQVQVSRSRSRSPGPGPCPQVPRSRSPGPGPGPCLQVTSKHTCGGEPQEKDLNTFTPRPSSRALGESTVLQMSTVAALYRTSFF